MIELKLAVLGLCSWLFWAGGSFNHNLRRFVLPCILTGYALFLTHQAWCLTMLLCMASFCLGYGDKSPLRHALGNGWGRSCWGLLAAICLSLPLFLTHHLSLMFGNPSSNFHIHAYDPLSMLAISLYCALNFTLENALKDVNQIIGDLVIGASFGSIVFLIYP